MQLHHQINDVSLSCHGYTFDALLVFNGTFSTKSVYFAMQKLKFVKNIPQDRKWKIRCLGVLVKL